MNDLVATNRPVGIGSYWLGGIIIAGSDIWSWESGESWSYTNWNIHQNVQNNNTCVYMNMNDNTWKNCNCIDTLPYICITNTGMYDVNIIYYYYTCMYIILYTMN
jgi:hypothetical protein